MVDISTLVSQTIARFELDPRLGQLILDSYQSGSLSQVVSNINSSPVSSYNVAGANELVIYSGTDPGGVGNKELANKYADRTGSTSYTLDDTAVGQYLNSNSTFSSATQGIQEQYNRILAADGEPPVVLTPTEQYAIQEPAFRLASTNLVDETTAASIKTFADGASGLR